ncbi:integrin beta-like protein 1 isoform X2 [Paramacrobiotus metropolitanus]|nr:integrin beta-like protein 1 isoform X2 [Paramacrobiotus metropolitanus]
MLLVSSLIIILVSCIQQCYVWANFINNTCIEPNPPLQRYIRPFFIRPEEPCSGPTRGDCVDGECICKSWTGEYDGAEDTHVRFYGKYCECDNVSCPRLNRVICGGRGICDCGKCVCNPPWVGSFCDITMESLSTMERLIADVARERAAANRTDEEPVSGQKERA